MKQNQVVTPSLEALGINRLTPQQRIALAQEILDTVVLEEELPQLTPAQREELRRRVAELEANPEAAVPWEDVRAAALTRCSQ
ncbi:MAG TPA: addiction module protein [Urbifossiella sp.]|nr:addiction module protein [Urbifossiella sp.]